MLKKIHKIKDIKREIHYWKKRGKKIGFVPTMGAIHDGHLSLIKKCVRENDISVVSIFVNPTQFGEGEDYNNYPRDLEKDKQQLQKEGVDYIFNPPEEEIYPKNFRTYVIVKELSNIMCGLTRQSHFQGVTTIVIKLFNIINPDSAYFGQKDAQQAIIIKQMIKDLNLNINLRVCPIIREKDGLAMSSRNKYLDKKQRNQAISLNKSLQLAGKLFNKGHRKVNFIKEKMFNLLYNFPLIKVDYIEIVDINSLKPLDIIKEQALVAVAAYLGKARLIDNKILGGNNEILCTKK